MDATLTTKSEHRPYRYLDLVHNHMVPRRGFRRGDGAYVEGCGRCDQLRTRKLTRSDVARG